MTNIFKILYLSIGLSFLIGCSQILQDVDLSFDEKDRVEQENFKVVEKTLTLSEAKSRQFDPYPRQVIQKGLANKARLISEKDAINSNFPEFQVPAIYKIGIGDTLTFSKLVEQSNQSSRDGKSWPIESITESYIVGPGDIIVFSKLIENLSNNHKQRWPKKIKDNSYKLGIGDQLTLIQMNEKNSDISDITNVDANASTLRALTQNDDSVIQTKGRIGSDGSVLLLEVGRLEASGKTINDLRLEVRNILIRNGLSPKFQLEITGFNSQKAFLTINNSTTSSTIDQNLTTSAGGILKLTDQPLTLREVLTNTGISERPGTISRIRLQRNSINYSFKLSEVFNVGSPDIIINDGDHIFINQDISELFKIEVRVGLDGGIVLPNLGEIKIAGKSIDEIEKEIMHLSGQKNGFWTVFKTEIISFNSQKAYITINNSDATLAADETQTSSAGNILKITDQPLTLREVLAKSGISSKPGIQTTIRLQRAQKDYYIDLTEIYAANARDIIIEDKDHIFVDKSISNLFSSSVKVGRDGEIILPNLGKMQVAGKSTNAIKKEVQKFSQRRDNFWTEFQLEVTEFKSQKAILSIPNNPNDAAAKSTLISISNEPMRLDEVLTLRGVTIDPNVLTKINLLRNGTVKSFLFSSLLLDPSKEIYLENGDRVIVEYLPYKQDKVFVLGAGISPTKFDISPSNRETLADALFTENGTLSSVDANKSEVYLLRGDDPVVAYHLNALNTSRLIVAEAMELRPNDILFVSEQPISSFNRALERIFPLRTLIGDVTSN